MVILVVTFKIQPEAFVVTDTVGIQLYQKFIGRHYEWLIPPSAAQRDTPPPVFGVHPVDAAKTPITF